MATFPTEIITEILSRLPVKSLIRFTSVCKSWKSLIKNPNYIKIHLNKTLASNSDSHLIICHKSIYIADLNLEHILSPLSFSELHHPLKPKLDEVFILGSCNGVLCISDLNRNNVFFYNPLTNWHRKLRVNYVIDPQTRKDQVIYGFGYDSVTDDYKVFSFFQTFHGPNWKPLYSEAKVLSFKSNSWKSVEKIPNMDCFQNYRGVYLNEAVYYIILSMDTFMLVNKFIVKFDFRTDTLFRVECPDYDDKLRFDLNLDMSSLNGCLCLLVSYFPEGSFPQTRMGEEGCLVDRIDLWMMKECGENEGWVRLFSIRNPRSIGIEYMISTIVFSRNGRKILMEVDQSKHGWYDLEDGSFERITTIGHPETLKAAPCFSLGTLVSLVDNKHLEGGSSGSGTLPKKKDKRNLDKFLSVGFKLKL